MLVHKLNPPWQKGRINGVGGKTEKGESARSCISREVREETDLVINKKDWIYLGNLMGNDWTMGVFTTIYNGEITDATSLEKERIEWFNTKKLPTTIINNLTWLIPLCLDKLENKEIKRIKIQY